MARAKPRASYPEDKRSEAFVPNR